MVGSSSGQAWSVPFAAPTKRTKARRPLVKNPVESFWTKPLSEDPFPEDEIDVFDFEKKRLEAVEKFESNVVAASEGLLKELEKKNGKKKISQDKSPPRQVQREPRVTRDSRERPERKTRKPRAATAFSIPFHGTYNQTFFSCTITNKHENI